MWEIQWDCELNIRRPYGAGSLWPWGTAGGTDDNPGSGPGAGNRGGFLTQEGWLFWHILHTPNKHLSPLQLKKIEMEQYP